MYTRQEIAEIADVYKMAVKRYVERNKIEPETKQGNTFYYSESQMRAIVEGLTATDETKQNETVAEQSETRNETAEQPENGKDELIKALNDRIAQQDKQIDNYQRQFETMQQLLDQQQRLNLSTQNLLEQQKTSPEAQSKDDQQDKEVNTAEVNEKPSEGAEQPKKSRWKFWR